MSDASLARIPFRAADEQMIGSMARWMQFIGVITMLGGLISMFLVMVAMVFLGFEEATAKVGQERWRVFIHENLVLLLALGVFALGSAVLSTYAGYVLGQASDQFDRVVRTDVADQAYLAAGLDRVKVYFQVFVLNIVLSMIVGMATAITLLAAYMRHS